MHSSLTPRTNLSLLLLTGVVIGVSLIYSSALYPVVLLPFAFVGLLAGILQSRALASDPAVFRSAESWAAVRKALMSSLYGKISLVLLWCNGAALLCLILFGEQLASLATVLAAYASFMFFRELATLRSVFTLSSKESPL